ncbi:indole-3-acetaldehyde oxidase-like [Apium graveolens]|uniref:indole-3-acetaldehyde oxidase-like n=1 Tax=Apium graveolens TaxID=4045 RepID=UPI003D78F5E9
MTAYALSSIQYDGTADLAEKVRVVQSDTLSLIQGGITSSSTTSELSCEVVRICCNILVERLVPLKESLQAYSRGLSLSASGYFVPDSNCSRYLNYGATVSEIEGAFVQGIGFFMSEEYLTNADGLVVADNTWTYMIPTIDTIPDNSILRY